MMDGIESLVICLEDETMGIFDKLKGIAKSPEAALLDECKGRKDLSKIGNLIAKGSSPNACNEFGVSAIKLATPSRPYLGFDNRTPEAEAQRHNYEREVARALDVISLLIARGASVDATDSSGYTALMNACGQNPCPPIVRLLLDKGANPNLETNDGLTALSFCIIGMDAISSHRTANLEILELLLSHGADPNKPVFEATGAFQGAFRGNVYPTAMDFILAKKLDRAETIMRRYGAASSQEIVDSIFSHIDDTSLTVAWDYLISRLQRTGRELGRESDFRLDLQKGKASKVDLVFLLYTTSLLSHMACVDGFPSPSELHYFSNFLEYMQLDIKIRTVLMNWFQVPIHLSLSQADVAKNFKYELDILRKVFQNDPPILTCVATSVLDMGFVDGQPTLQERDLLDATICAFGLESSDYNFYRQGGRPDSEAAPFTCDYYAVLRCSPGDSDEHIKQQYRKLAKDFHPDIIQGKDLPEDFIKFANRRFQEIQEAYEKVVEDRKRNPGAASHEPEKGFNGTSAEYERTKESETAAGSAGPLVVVADVIAGKVQSLLEEAEDAERKKDWNAAIESYEDILDLCPEYVDVKKLLDRARRKAQQADPPAPPPPSRVPDDTILFVCGKCKFRGRISRSKLPAGARQVRVGCPKCKEKTKLELAPEHREDVGASLAPVQSESLEKEISGGLELAGATRKRMHCTIAVLTPRAQVFELKNRLTSLGKGDDADIKCFGLGVGRKAAFITEKSNGFYLHYNEGLSKPRVKRKAEGKEKYIDGPFLLQDGDEIAIGNNKMLFHLVTVG